MDNTELFLAGAPQRSNFAPGHLARGDAELEGKESTVGSKEFNRVGTEGRFRFWGGSHGIDPWGNVVAEAAQGEEQVLTVAIDLAEIRRRRRQVPLVKETRLGLIQREIRRRLDEGGDL